MKTIEKCYSCKKFKRKNKTGLEIERYILAKQVGKKSFNECENCKRIVRDGFIICENYKK